MVRYQKQPLETQVVVRCHKQPLDTEVVVWCHKQPLDTEVVVWCHKQPLDTEVVVWCHKQPLETEVVVWSHKQPLDTEVVVWCYYLCGVIILFQSSYGDILVVASWDNFPKAAPQSPNISQPRKLKHNESYNQPYVSMTVYNVFN